MMMAKCCGMLLVAFNLIAHATALRLIVKSEKTLRSDKPYIVPDFDKFLNLFF